MPAIELSAPFVDVGLFTNAGEALRQFYGETLGLPFLGRLNPKPGHRLYRYDANGSLLKINVVDAALPPRQTNYRRILLAEPGRDRPASIRDPDGTEIERVPVGWLGIDQLGIGMRVATIELADHTAAMLGATRIGDGRFRLGSTVLLFEVAADAPSSGALESVGFSYTTLRARDVDTAHASLLAAGALQALPPTTLVVSSALTLKLSFVRDPMGNWVELTQRLQAESR